MLIRSGSLGCACSPTAPVRPAEAVLLIIDIDIDMLSLRTSRKLAMLMSFGGVPAQGRMLEEVQLPCC